jgi:peroxiredoxin 2/4
MYGMLPNNEMSQTVRSVFIICPEQKIRAILQYPMTNGRSIPEILRLLDALQITDREKVVTPANWTPGMPVIVPYPQTYDALLERVKNPSGYNCIDWYLCYKQVDDYIQTPMMEQMPIFNMPMNMIPNSMQQNQNMYMGSNQMNSYSNMNNCNCREELS